MEEYKKTRKGAELTFGIDEDVTKVSDGITLEHVLKKDSLCHHITTALHAQSIFTQLVVTILTASFLFQRLSCLSLSLDILPRFLDAMQLVKALLRLY